MKIILILFFSFMYADCQDIDNQIECESSDHCEWHTDDMACEDAEHDDHDDHVHCEDFTNETDCAASDDCEWHTDDMACEDAEHDDHDDHVHCEDFTNETDCAASDDCEWHTDDMACEDAEHDDHDHGDCEEDDHVNVDGLILEFNGNEVYSQFQGAITGSLDLHVNDNKELSVHFLDQYGLEIDIEQAECYPLSFQISDPSIISITTDEHDEDHDEHDEHEHCDDITEQTECESSDHCEWHSDDMACEDAEHDDDSHEDEHGNSFEITGLATGSTTFSLLIMHEGHADFTSMPILVTVEEENDICLPGDVNGDNIINVVDIVNVVENILSAVQPDDICSYDYSGDMIVNVVDVVEMVNYILNLN